MLTRKERYNRILERLAKAESYFQTRFKDDTEEGKAWALEEFSKLVLEHEKLYKEMRPTSVTPELQYGFQDSRLTLQLDIENEIAFILERLDIVRADGWKIDRMEYLKQSKQLLVSMIRV